MKQKDNYNGFKKTIRLITNIISWTVLVVLLIIAAFLAYYFIANKLYEAKGEKFEPAVGLYTIVSPSMTPNLNVYDVILDTKVKKPEDIKVGDIITFVSTSSISKGLTITHRVVAIVETENGLEYKTQGDNNLTPDSTTVQFKNVLGKVAFRIPQLGRAQSFLSSSYGWLIIVVIPALLIIISDIVKIFRLNGAKKKVSNALTSETEQEKREEEQKEEIKEKLKKRYQKNRAADEKEPLPTDKELTKVSINGTKIEETNIEKEEIIEEPLVSKETIEEKNSLKDIPNKVMFDLPKLKEEVPVKNTGKRRKRKKNK